MYVFGRSGARDREKGIDQMPAYKADNAAAEVDAALEIECH